MRANLVLVAFVLVTLPHQTFSHWWFISQVFALGAKVMCNSIAGLVSIQRQLCREFPDVMVSIGKGAKLGVEECQFQFRDQRWNCSTVDRDTTVFGRVMRRASRETAFVYAISSAGVVHEVTRSCSLGELKDCSCRNKKGQSRKGFEWGGCSDNIQYGLNFAKAFVDSREVERDARALANLHNNNAGRRVVKTSMQLECKCHGVSGSCSVKTCWRSLSPFRIVGLQLREKYKEAMQVTVGQSGTQLTSAEVSYRKPTRDELVFLEESPDYCMVNSNTGSIGTSGRECNRTTLDLTGSCSVLCCGRGFNTMQVEEEYKCHCKFHWCCHVKCQICRRTVDRHICKAPTNGKITPYSGSAPGIAATHAKGEKSRRKKGKKKKKDKKKRKNKNRNKGKTGGDSIRPNLKEN